MLTPVKYVWFYIIWCIILTGTINLTNTRHVKGGDIRNETNSFGVDPGINQKKKRTENLSNQSKKY